MFRSRRRACRLVASAALAVVVAACGGGAPGAARPAATDGRGGGGGGGEVRLRLGYLPNVTHAPAIVAKERGIFEADLGRDVAVEYSAFGAGPEAVQAIMSGALDAVYIGASPTVIAWARTRKGVRVVAGAASGGAFLVVRPGIDSAADLEGRWIATPQLGGTQDIALRAWLKRNGLETDPAGGGDVAVVPQANAQTLAAFEQGRIAGAWVPEPWAARLVREAGGRVLVDEATLWPRGRYATTHLIVRAQFLSEHRDVVKNLVKANADAITFIRTDRARAEALVADGIEKVTGKEIGVDLVTASFDHITFTNDPIASSLRQSARDAHDLGLIEPVDLDGLYDLTLLNEVLRDRNEPPVSDT